MDVLLPTQSSGHLPTVCCGRERGAQWGRHIKFKQVLSMYTSQTLHGTYLH